MKKFLTAFFIFMLAAPMAQAATMRSDYANNISQKAIHILAPIVITAEADGEIRAEHGLMIFLDNDRRILWDTSGVIIASGTAVDQGRVETSPVITYSKDYKSVHIALLEDFAAEEAVTITGLTVRTYDREFSNRFMGLDLNGDGEAEVTDLNGYKVNSNVRTDQAIPYPVTDLSHEVSDQLDSVTLRWQVPPDYDITGITVDKKLTGSEVFETLLSNTYTTYVTDNDLKAGDDITYRIYARDQRNNGEMTELRVLVADQEESEEEEEESPPEEVTPVSETERASLTRFFNYYRVRYSIKCLPSGVPVAEGNSACLWAKIDLAYAQNRLSRDEVAVDLSQRNLDIIESRLRFSSDRYQRNCAEATERASYCSALGKALERARYFLD